MKKLKLYLLKMRLQVLLKCVKNIHNNKSYNINLLTEIENIESAIVGLRLEIMKK